MYDLLINILTHPAIGIATFLVGILLGNFFAIGRDRRNDFNKAAKEFRNAFLPELIFLKHNAKISGSASSDDLHEFLLAGYVHRHLKALEIFRNYLSTKERTNIDKAWQKYCHHPDNPEILYFEQYSNKSTNSTQKSEASLKKFAIERIEDILKFAEPLK